MLKIKTNKGYLDLGGDFTVQIDEKSPVMNDRGSQTVPVTVPVTANNAGITGFAHRLDMGVKPMNEDQTCTVLDGVRSMRSRPKTGDGPRRKWTP